MMKFFISLLIFLPVMQSNAQSIKANINSGEEILTPQNFDLLKNYILENGRNDGHKLSSIVYTDSIHYTRFGLQKSGDVSIIEISKINPGKTISDPYFILSSEDKIKLVAKEDSLYKNALIDLNKYLDYIKRVKRGEKTLAFFKQHLKKDLTIAQVYQIFGEPDADAGSAMMLALYYVNEGRIDISIAPYNALSMRASFTSKEGKEELLIP